MSKYKNPRAEHWLANMPQYLITMLWRLFLLLNKDFIFDFNGFILILS